MLLSGRIPYIDALRGFAILLVIAGHVIQTLYGTDGLVFRCIYSFHMPLFMFLSGFVSYKATTWKSVGKRFLQLIVPFFCYNVIAFFVDSSAGISLREFAVFNLRIILRPDLGLWFLWVLFFIHTLFIFWYFIFFSAGVYIRPFSQTKHVGLDQGLLTGSAVLFPVCVYFFRLQTCITPPLQVLPGIDLEPYLSIFYRLWVAALGIVLFYEIFKWTVTVGTSYCAKILIALGRETLGLYFVHCLIINLAIAPFVSGLGLIPVWTVLTIGVVLTAVSYLIVKLLRRNHLTRLLVLGDYICCKK